jgi:pyruvate/2-oxoglutarate dehydrogenase complex dihydrolipoamide dehydrogenase (E3) component
MFLTNSTANKVWQDGNKIKIEYFSSGCKNTIEASHLLVATGIKANTEKLSLGTIGGD